MLYLQRRPLDETTHLSQHLAAYALLTYAISQEYGYAHVEIARDARGKPFLPEHPELFVSLAHCRGMVACALDRAPVGVDTEAVRTVRSRILRRSFSETERILVENAADPDLIFTQLWTLKESYIKAIGMGLAYPLDRICFAFLEDRIISNHRDAGFTGAITSDGFVIALCHQAGKGQIHRIEQEEGMQCFNWI